MLCARERMVSPSPAEMLPLELMSQGPSTASRSPTDAQCFRKRQLHHRILRLLNTLHKQIARRLTKYFRLASSCFVFLPSSCLKGLTTKKTRTENPGHTKHCCAYARAARTAGLLEYCRTTAITCSGLISDKHSSFTSRQQRSVLASISPPMHGAHGSLERKTMWRSFRGTSCSGSVGPKIEITRGTLTASARCSVEVSLVMNSWLKLSRAAVSEKLKRPATDLTLGPAACAISSQTPASSWSPVRTI